eukprot:3853787-Pleurochrysis_carterae.AAC.1
MAEGGGHTRRNSKAGTNHSRHEKTGVITCPKAHTCKRAPDNCQAREKLTTASTETEGIGRANSFLELGSSLRRRRIGPQA